MGSSTLPLATLLSKAWSLRAHQIALLYISYEQFVYFIVKTGIAFMQPVC